MSSNLPQLRQVSIPEILALKSLPKPTIQTDTDVQTWRQTRSYQDYSVFLHRLNESVVGCNLPWTSEVSRSITSAVDLLDTLDGWIDQIPPLKTPQRFGNLAFRTWGLRLEEEADGLLLRLLPGRLSVLAPQVKPFLLTSFGSFTRMDYGTGHETSFALFLLCLTLVRFFDPVLKEERELVLVVFLRYLRLCWRLQDVYRLEPAGSHGVWGLDDSHFLPYIFGSGELRDQTEFPVSAVLAPKLPPTNLYFLCIGRIKEVKQGPFHEHSSQLHSIATAVPNWNKVNTGLFKMYEAEVLGKRVVVQHIPLGGLLDWDVPSTSSEMFPLSPMPRTAQPLSQTSHTKTYPQYGNTAPPSSNSVRLATSRAPWSATPHPSTAVRTAHLPRNTTALPNEKRHESIGQP